MQVGPRKLHFSKLPPDCLNAARSHSLRKAGCLASCVQSPSCSATLHWAELLNLHPSVTASLTFRTQGFRVSGWIPASGLTSNPSTPLNLRVLICQMGARGSSMRLPWVDRHVWPTFKHSTKSSSRFTTGSFSSSQRSLLCSGGCR